MVKVLGVVVGGPKGQLGVEATTSTDLIRRGDAFDVELKVRNGFKSPVKITACKWQPTPGLKTVSVGETNLKRKAIVLQANDTCRISFRLASISPLRNFLSRFISPKSVLHTGTQHLVCNISYKVANQLHLQDIPVTLNIHPNPFEIYVSAIVGGILGSAIKTRTLGIDLLLSGVLSFMLVLIAQRRTDVQIGVSIEDWVGGLVTGFFVGYLGTAYFAGFLPKT